MKVVLRISKMLPFNSHHILEMNRMHVDVGDQCGNDFPIPVACSLFVSTALADTGIHSLSHRMRLESRWGLLAGWLSPIALPFWHIR